MKRPGPFANKKQMLERRAELKIRPLQDVVLDAILHAVRSSGSIFQAAPLLDVSEPTVRKRIRAGYSDRTKAKV